jgi:hypothetical protein
MTFRQTVLSAGPPVLSRLGNRLDAVRDHLGSGWESEMLMMNSLIAAR